MKSTAAHGDKMCTCIATYRIVAETCNFSGETLSSSSSSYLLVDCSSKEHVSNGDDDDNEILAHSPTLAGNKNYACERLKKDACVLRHPSWLRHI